MSKIYKLRNKTVKKLPSFIFFITFMNDQDQNYLLCISKIILSDLNWSNTIIKNEDKLLYAIPFPPCIRFLYKVASKVIELELEK